MYLNKWINLNFLNLLNKRLETKVIFELTKVSLSNLYPFPE